MPFVNTGGHIAHGVGAQGAFLDNVQFDTGGGACWFSPTTIVYQHSEEDGWHLSFYNTTASPPSITQAHVNGANTLFGSGAGHWAAWLHGVGLFSSMGFTKTAASLLAMGKDGSIAYKPDYQAMGGLQLRRINGDELHLSDGPAADVYIVGDKQVVWQEGNVLKSYGMPPIKVLDGGVWFPKVIAVAGKWWISYYSGMYGNVLHPIDSLEGLKPVTTMGDAWCDMAVLTGQPNVIRFAWSTTQGEAAGDVHYTDIDVTDVDTALLGTGTTISSTTAPLPLDAVIDETGTRTITSMGTFGVAAAAEELVTLPIEIFPAFPNESGYGRIVHPILGAFDYEVKPDEWVNIDADAIIPPVWASSRTLTSAANVLWQGHLRDVVVEERWKALGGLAMPITQLRMLLAIWTTPIDPDVGYVHWHPNYITQVGFKVLPVQLSAGGQGITFDDVVNYKDEDGEPIGWITAPVTFQLKLVERL